MTPSPHAGAGNVISPISDFSALSQGNPVHKKEFKLEKPLLTFDGTKGAEEFQKFIQTFELYISSKGLQTFAMEILQSWLSGTPLLVYQQFRRDQPLGNFSDIRPVLEKSFGKPLDGRRAVHKLQQTSWKTGQPLIELATEIRDLHYRAHPQTPVAERDTYAGDTFIRCLPEDWQIKLRERFSGCTL